MLGPKMKNWQKVLKSDEARKNGPHISPENDDLGSGRPWIPPEIGALKGGPWMRREASFPQLTQLLPLYPLLPGELRPPGPPGTPRRLSYAYGSAARGSPREDFLEQGGCGMTESTLYKGSFCLDKPDHLRQCSVHFLAI